MIHIATGNKAGRPRKEINEDMFKKLCALQCTQEEIAYAMNCSSDTIERWCKREFGHGFVDEWKIHAVAGKISLRRYQFELAKKSAAMAIFLGKQYLGQRDNPGGIEGTDDPVIKLLEAWNDAAGE